MRAIAKVHTPEDSILMRNKSEVIREEEQVAEEKNKRGKNVKVTTKENEGWIKPIHFATITHFDIKVTKVRKHMRLEIDMKS